MIRTMAVLGGASLLGVIGALLCYDQGKGDAFYDGYHEGWQAGLDRGRKLGREETSREVVNICAELNQGTEYECPDFLDALESDPSDWYEELGSGFAATDRAGDTVWRWAPGTAFDTSKSIFADQDDDQLPLGEPGNEWT